MDDEPANIWVAASDGNLERVQELLHSGIHINAQDETGYSPIHAAVSYGHTELINFLIANGADINLRDHDGDTPLLACEEPEIFEMLVLQHGANPKDVNTNDENIFDKAVQDENENMISYLISHEYISNEEVKAMTEKNNLALVMSGDGNNMIDDYENYQIPEEDDEDEDDVEEGQS